MQKENKRIRKSPWKLRTKIKRKKIETIISLGIEDKLVKDCLTNPLYVKVLAVNSDSKDLIPLICSNSKLPVLTRKSDSVDLKKTAKKCFEKDVLANDLHSHLTKTKTNEHQMLII